MEISQMWNRFSSYFQQKVKGGGDQASHLSSFLWIFPFLVPFLAIILSYLLQRWSWGLMDDALILSSGSGVVDRTCTFFNVMLQFGQFRPMLALHAGFFYTLFEGHPNWLYISKAMEIALLLLIWGMGAYRLTKKCLSVLFFAVVTLSFHYFYDAFFYISSHEMIGLFFCGIAFHFFLNNLESILGADFNGRETQNKSFGLKSFIAGVFFLLCAFGSKEPFVSCGIAFGFSYLYLAWSNRKYNWSKLLVSGVVLVAITCIYGWFLLTFVKSVYTAKYAFNVPLFISNFKIWFKKDFFNHLPWIIGAIFIFYLNGGFKKIWKSIAGISTKNKWGIILGFFLYIGYFLVLLPWSTIAYYATPFGLFFALIICLLTSDNLIKAPIKVQLSFTVCALMFNMLVCQYALERESTYQYDTINFMEWVHENPVFRENNATYNVLCNAMEASNAIPWHINRKWDLNIERFHWSTDPYAIFHGKEADFFLYSPRFHSIDLGKLKRWEIVFWSKNWRMYRRVY